MTWTLMRFTWTTMTGGRIAQGTLSEVVQVWRTDRATNPHTIYWFRPTGQPSL